MKRAATKSAAILLFAVTLFFVGPQLGSLDIDGDGVPDVPVLVMDGSGGQNVQARRIDAQARIARDIASLFSELARNHPGLVERRIAANLRTAGPESRTPLRC